MRLELLEDQIVDGITGCPVLIDHDRKGSQVLMIGRPLDIDTMRLIAAAPRLLFALQQAVELQNGVEDHRPDWEGTPKNTIVWMEDAALAAIRAATGEGV